MDSRQVCAFLQDKNWVDDDLDSRFIHPSHPYIIIVAGDEVQISLRENTGPDDGQNGEEIGTFQSIDELQEWYENQIGE